MNLTGQLSASSNQDIANLGVRVPTSEDGEDNKRKPAELHGKEVRKSPKRREKVEKLEKHSEHNSFMTLAIPTIDRESTVRQSASKLILKVDENSSQALQLLPANGKLVGASFNFGQTHTTF